MPVGYWTWRDVRLESVMRSKAEVERHHDMDRIGNLLPCADRCCGDVELTIGNVQAETVGVAKGARCNPENFRPGGIKNIPPDVSTLAEAGKRGLETNPRPTLAEAI